MRGESERKFRSGQTVGLMRRKSDEHHDDVDRVVNVAGEDVDVLEGTIKRISSARLLRLFISPLHKSPHSPADNTACPPPCHR